MSTLLDDIAAATKGKSFKTYKYGFDGIDVSLMTLRKLGSLTMLHTLSRMHMK